MVWLLSHLWLIGSSIGVVGLGALGFAFPQVSVPILTTLWNWLCHRSFWQLVSLGLGIALLVDHLEVLSSHRETNNWKSQYTKLHQQYDAASAQMKQKDAQLVRLSAQIRKANDEANSRIVSDAYAIRLSGPGKSACKPLTPASSGGLITVTPNPDAAGSSMSTEDSAAVPWGWLTERAEEHDKLLNENQHWRDWYAALAKSWPK